MSSAEADAAWKSRYAVLSLAHKEAPEVEAEEVLERVRAGDPKVKLVDCRDAVEYDTSHLPGAVLLSAFDENAVDGPETLVCCYCTIGYRSGLTAIKLRKLGHNAVNMRGSILAWTHVGGPLVDKASNPTTTVHVWSKNFAYTAEGYTPIW